MATILHVSSLLQVARAHRWGLLHDAVLPVTNARPCRVVFERTHAWTKHRIPGTGDHDPVSMKRKVFGAATPGHQLGP